MYQKRNMITQYKIPKSKESLESPKYEIYSLKQNIFDPSKSSPPNEFMIKLHMRMNKYHERMIEDNLEMQ